ncbi:MAG: glycosyltransferase family 4 protein [Muribaculaceae bacterium]|nr:glycosyltransferase family 4 protein [Muribaculaceae bacterium]
MTTTDTIFDKVLFIGPYASGKGGVVTVLTTYRRHIEPFHFAATCSRGGMVASAFSFAWLLVKLPFVKLFTARRILHIHFASYGSFFRKSIVMRWGKALRFRVIGHCHGAEFKMFAEKKGFDKVAATLKKCDAIIALSESWRRFFVDSLHCSDVTTVFNPIEKADNPTNEVSDRIKLLFLGRIGQRKGLFDLIDTIIAHKAEFDGKIHLTIGGDGDVEKLIATINAYGLSDIIDYVGWASGEKKNRLLNEANILILPSHNEGLPVSVLEAMAHGKAIIASAVGGIPEVVENGRNGFLITPGDNNSIHKSISNYISDPEMAAVHGKESLAMIADAYPEKVKHQLKNIYSRLL